PVPPRHPHGRDAPQGGGLLERVRRTRSVRRTFPRLLERPRPAHGAELLGAAPEALRGTARRKRAGPSGPPVQPHRLPPTLVPHALSAPQTRPPLPPPPRPVVFVFPGRGHVPAGRRRVGLRPVRPLLPAQLGPRPPLPLPLPRRADGEPPLPALLPPLEAFLPVWAQIRPLLAVV